MDESITEKDLDDLFWVFGTGHTAVSVNIFDFITKAIFPQLFPYGGVSIWSVYSQYVFSPFL